MKAKKIIISVAFVAWLAFFAVFSLLLKDSEYSTSERRALEQFETYSAKKEAAERRGKEYGLTEYLSWIETYLIEQFPERDDFRAASVATRFYLLLQRDYNGYYIVDGSACSMDPTLNKEAVSSAAVSINNLYDSYFAPSDSDAYFCVIPDKNYFYAEKNGYLHYDYNEMLDLLKSSINEDISYIDIFPLLDGKNYYKTDPHWDQSSITPVAQHILSEMGSEVSSSDYEEIILEGFEGTYSVQSALPMSSENIILKTNSIIENCVVTDYETNSTTSVYDLSDFKNVDPYDVFLGGAKALLKIENPAQSNNKQLVVFRDSFGSSLVPLLIDGYSEIIVADTRYIHPSIITNYVDFRSDCDVLFIYSTSILNSKGVFKQ